MRRLFVSGRWPVDLVRQVTDNMSDLDDFSKTLPKLETVDAEAIPGGLEPGSGSAKLKFGESTGRKKNIPKGLWTKCGKCSELIFDKDLDENLKTCTSCGYHFPISARAPWAPVTIWRSPRNSIPS